MEHITIARPYASAAIRFAHEAGALKSWHDALSALSAIIADERIRALCTVPSTDAGNLEQVLLEAVVKALKVKDTKALPKGFAEFVALLLAAGRIILIADIARLFERAWQRHEGIQPVHVESAYPIERTDALEAMLEKRFNGKVALSVVENRNLAAGIKIQADDWVWDMSIAARLAALQSSLVL